MKVLIFVLLASAISLSLTLLFENSSLGSTKLSTSANKSIQAFPGMVINKLEMESEESAIPGLNLSPGYVIKGGGESVLHMPYTVTVTFDSMTVNDDHDHSLSPILSNGDNGDGEYEIAAFVQGKPIDLTAASNNELRDVSDDETVYFKPGSEVTVDIPKSRGLSIMTLGLEEDCGCSLLQGCGFIAHPQWTDLEEIVPILNGPKEQRFDAIQQIQTEFKHKIDKENDVRGCKRENIGEINKIYEPPGQSYESIGYGAGAHTNVVSNNGDFTLRYTVSVTAPPQIVVAAEPDSGGCNTNLTAINATSSGSRVGFPPTNVIDNNFNTRWISTLIPTPTITLDLGSQNPVCGAQIAWADGNVRSYRFNVSVSTDGTNFANVLSGSNTGSSTSPEKYTFVATTARFVRITVTENIPGSPNSLVQISEIDALGKGLGTLEASDITLKK